MPLIELELVVAAEHVVRGGLGQHRRDLELVARPQLLQLLRRPSVVVTWAAAAEEEALRVRPPPLPGGALTGRGGYRANWQGLPSRGKCCVCLLGSWVTDAARPLGWATHRAAELGRQNAGSQ